MSKSPDLIAIEEIAIELGVNASFIEKDWYAVQVLRIIADIEDDICTPVFSGGTSLSKGYNLIERFSEDLDFKISTSGELTRSEKRTYREKVRQQIEANNIGLKILEIKVGNEGNFFQINLKYPKQLDIPHAIRPHLQLEFTFGTDSIETEMRTIRSFETQFKDQEAECSILCVKPIETASDKVSALIWRVKNRDRSNKNDDPSLIRHLHDIAKLKANVEANTGLFKKIVQKTYERDHVRSNISLPVELKEAISEVIVTLEEDQLYQEEYRSFVESLSYAEEDNQINFKDAISALKDVESLL